MSKVCLNHPDREATNRCIVCFKPLCDECVISDNGEAYCSEKCLNQARSTVGNIERFQQAEKRAKFRRLIANTFKLIVILAVLGAVAYYLIDKKIIKL